MSMNKSKVYYEPSISYLSWLKEFIFSFPSPLNLSIFWNLGSMLGVCLSIQIISGLFLSMFYFCGVDSAFESVVNMTNDVNFGWFIQKAHMNGASLFFACLYIHIGRGLYYFSFRLRSVWVVGVGILLMSMITAFMGYVLPWGQMSFWGATVITNLLSAIPYWGISLVHWVWGGFSVGESTLNRFYSIHFFTPFVILGMVGYHLVLLHSYGSTNFSGTSSYSSMSSFNDYFYYKDMVWFTFLGFILLFLVCVSPYYLGDPDNFIPANPMSTPPHIKPEWYFLFAYAILRSIPNKLGGVVALMFSVLALLIFPLLKFPKFSSSRFYLTGQAGFWTFFSIFCSLTFLGAQPIEYPYESLSLVLSVFYFFVWGVVWMTILLNDLILFLI